ncbi:hypothetical protein ACE6H2_026676 [Prunus campanulata]
MDRGLQMLAANYYPPCPQPEYAIGIPHHTDHGLVALLIQNEMNGLQVEHNGKWLTVDGPTNSPELMEKEGEAPKYLAMNYKEYIQLQRSGKIYMKYTFDHIRA